MRKSSLRSASFVFLMLAGLPVSSQSPSPGSLASDADQLEAIGAFSGPSNRDRSASSTASDPLESALGDWAKASQEAKAFSPKLPECPRSFIAYPNWSSGSTYKFPRLDRSFQNAYFDAFAEDSASGDGFKVSEAFRACVDNAIETVQSNSYYILNGLDRPSELALAGPNLLMFKSLSYLYPRDPDRQDPIAAAKTAKEALLELQNVMAQASQQLRAKYYAEQRRLEEERLRAQRQYEQDRRVATLTAILSGYLAHEMEAPPDQVVNAVRRPFESLEQQRERVEERLNEHLASLARLELRAMQVNEFRWDEDGVRLHVVRFGSNLNEAHGPAQGQHDHTQYLVRVLSEGGGMCTGALVGHRLVLTAQHCFVDEDGSVRTPREVRWEGMTYDRDSGFRKVSYSVSVVGYSTAPERWFVSWRNDWAILKLERKIFDSAGYLAIVHADLLSQVLDGRRVSLAGYSTDLDDGAYITMDWGCSVKGIKDGVLSHRCKHWKGASGSPIVVASGPYKGAIVAVNAFASIRHDTAGGGGATAAQFLAAYRRLREWDVAQ